MFLALYVPVTLAVLAPAQFSILAANSNLPFLVVIAAALYSTFVGSLKSEAFTQRLV